MRRYRLSFLQRCSLDHLFAKALPLCAVFVHRIPGFLYIRYIFDSIILVILVNHDEVGIAHFDLSSALSFVSRAYGRDVNLRLGAK